MFFVGSYLQEGDLVRWVLGNDCNKKIQNNHTFANDTITTGPQGNVSATFLFGDNLLAGRNLTLCK